MVASANTKTPPTDGVSSSRRHKLAHTHYTQHTLSLAFFFVFQARRKAVDISVAFSHTRLGQVRCFPRDEIEFSFSLYFNVSPLFFPLLQRWTHHYYLYPPLQSLLYQVFVAVRRGLKKKKNGFSSLTLFFFTGALYSVCVDRTQRERNVQSAHTLFWTLLRSETVENAELESIHTHAHTQARHTPAAARRGGVAFASL